MCEDQQELLKSHLESSLFELLRDEFLGCLLKRFSGDAKPLPELSPEVAMTSPEVVMTSPEVTMSRSEVVMTSPEVMMTSPEVVLTGRLGSGKAISFFPGLIRSVWSDEKHLQKYYRLTSSEPEGEGLRRDLGDH